MELEFVLKILWALVCVGLLVAAGVWTLKRRLKGDTVVGTVYRVKGMACENCKMRVEEAVKALPGVRDALASPRKKTLIVDGDDVSEEKLRETIEALGYTFGGRK